MKVILPMAGKGTRLLPATKFVPKPLIRLAGRSVLDRLMDKVLALDVDELLIITGHLKEKLEEHVVDNYDVPARFIEQKVQDGTATAVHLAQPYVDGPVLIVFVDTIFDVELAIDENGTDDGTIWVHEVEDYQRFGVIVTDSDGYMTKIVEKPSEPVSRLANVGLYYIRDSAALFAGIDWTMSRPPYKGEYFLTDAFQHMVDNGKKIKIEPIRGWYDCGKLETTLDTNRYLLENGGDRVTEEFTNVKIEHPIYIGDDVLLEDCSIGPNVSVDDGTTIHHSSIRDSIIGRNSKVVDSTVTRSLIGDCSEISDDFLEGAIVARDERAEAP
ncbi:MAG: sugar phosphate nucleotidyltransferase [Gemmatimonadetes bacterium]|nr:sugar phosphate nucleotidyltransferase [Gemmatimonadota bacterium]